MKVRGAIIVAVKRVPRIDRRPAHTLQRSQARSQGSVASTVGKPSHPFPSARGTIDTGRHTAAPIKSGDPVETKRAAHRFSVIRVRPLNDPRRGSLGWGQHSPGRVKRWHAQPTPGAYAAAVTSAVSAIIASTVGRVQRFQDAIAQRCSPGLASNRSTVKPLSPPPRHLHQVRTDASVPIGLLIPTPRQRVSPI